VGCAITSKGLDEAVRRELAQRRGQASVTMGGRVCFRWTSGSEGPVLHTASQVVLLFSVISTDEIAELREHPDGIYSALGEYAEAVARAELPQALDLAHQGVEPAVVAVMCRPSGPHSGRGAERDALGDEVTVPDVEAAILAGILRARGHTMAAESVLQGRPQRRRRGNREDTVAKVVAFVGVDHLALGIEVLRPKEGNPRGLRFPWRQVPKSGMEPQLAGAMAMHAVESAGSGKGLVVDPACGVGTLLLATARSWRGDFPRFIGVDRDKAQIDRCLKNFAACGLDSSNIRLGDARDSLEDIESGSASTLCSATFPADSSTLKARTESSTTASSVWRHGCWRLVEGVCCSQRVGRCFRLPC